MLKRFIYVLLAAVALVTVSCNKNDGPNEKDGEVTESDLVGSWGWNEKASFIFKADGSYTDSRWEDSVSGKWTLKDALLTCTPNGQPAWDTEVVLTGGKAWLVFVFEDEVQGEKYRSCEVYRKIGAKVESGTLGDGRWDAPHDGYRPAAFTKDVDYGVCMVVKGSNIDMYVPSWGLHIQGSFTLSDGKLHIDTDDDHIWKACYRTGNANEGSIGWQAWGPPTEEFEANWDYSYGSMNAETFELQSPYTWHTITQILAMGEKRRPGDPAYEKESYMFKYMIYDFGENEREIALELCDLDLCVTADGKEAYASGAAIGRSPWLYKR